MPTRIFNLIFTVILIAASSTLYSQSTNTAIDFMKSHNAALSTFTFPRGDSCSRLNPEIHDGNIHTNAYTKTSDSVRWAILFRPNTYPWVYKSVCVGFTSMAPGSSLTYRVVAYDTSSYLNGPSTLLYESDPITISSIPVFPNYNWYSNLIDLPVLYTGPVYIGVVYSNQPAGNVYISADETSPTTWPGYLSTYAGYPQGFTPIQQDTSFAHYKGLAIRTEGMPLIADNFALKAPGSGYSQNYVSIPPRPEMSGLNALTIEAWVNINTRDHGNGLLVKDDSSLVRTGYTLLLSELVHPDSCPAFICNGVTVAAHNILIQTGIWQHFAFTYDGTTAKFYINCKLEYAYDVALSLAAPSGSMKIASANDVVSPFGGKIDEMRFWNVARTQGQLDSNKCIKYPSGFIGGQNGLLALWHFDNSYNDSISGWNGIPRGQVTFDTVNNPIPGATCIEIPIGIQQQGTQVPKNYLLGQNYPNPFNPSTEISFSLPKDEFVELKVYDVAGNEIATLLSEPVRKGNYKVSFDASRLASGVYFYSIIAGSFKESKKMVLIK